jgi:AraC-like DNA-binding protein
LPPSACYAPFSVQAISQRLDYQDPLHFSRAFQQINGLSPSQ